MPLGNAALSWIPVHINGSWFNLVRARIGAQVLLALCHGSFPSKSLELVSTNLAISTTPVQASSHSSEALSGNRSGQLEERISLSDTSPDSAPVLPLSVLLGRVGEFQFGFAGARLDIAHEPAQPLLREIAPRDTLLLLCTHVPSGLVVFPTMRPLPESQRRVMLDVFWELFGAAQIMIVAGSVKQIALTRDIFRFVCASEGDCIIYAMFAVESLSGDHAFAITSEILESFRVSINADES